jgi:hypothetical protein
MMKYYKLFDEMTDSDRWHLGEVTLPDGEEPPLLDGIRLERMGELVVPVTDAGRPLDFCLTSFAVPVASRAVAEAVSAVAGNDVQCLPVEIPGHPGMYVLNALRVLPCLDERRSEFIKWTTKDHRADLAGQYRQVTRLVLDPAAIPPDAHFFRVDGWEVVLIVSADVKRAMEHAGCAGAEFTEVTPRNTP